jgi:periplasmic divalent cation tolerance protein
VEESQEIQLQMKTPVNRKKELLDWLSANHPYEVPEIVVQPVLDVAATYLAWAEAETGRVVERAPVT